MSLPDAIVWDLDGTLIDSAPDLATALNSVLDMRGFMPHPVEAVRAMIGNGLAELVKRGFNAAGARPDAEQLERLVLLVRQEYNACLTERSRPYPGIVQALEQCRALAIPMGVCTNKPETPARAILEGLGLSSFFKSVIGGDSTPVLKPDPLPLLTCLGELGADPASSLMIGDSEVDVGVARAAGLTIGLVPWGYTSTLVEKLGADFILRDPQDLLEVLRHGPDAISHTTH
jgi:phosphoglycolate phosphatase